MRQYEGALFALEAALTQMRAIDCDARDYYVQGPGVWEQAHAEHEARLRGVQEMIGAYNEILSHIHDSVGTALKEVR